MSPVIAAEGFLWSDEEASLYIPVHQHVSAFGPKRVAWIKRGFNPKTYRTYPEGSGRVWGLYRGLGATPIAGSPPERSLVVVESVLDALRVAQAGWDAMALCGTSLQPDGQLFYLTEGYKSSIVFLDADNPKVLMAARKVAKALAPASVVDQGTDPKRFPNEELQRLLQEAEDCV